jgi:alkanesulfonate monooxygenase SsuD/methylene tetrahydromethanopterin reductase-like flavin-dependent oxidoreductase (luciferase family)
MQWLGADIAREAEAAGVSAFATGDFVDHDAYTTLADMVTHTEKALVGTAIAYAFARTPYAHAAAVRNLARHAPERIFLGLGSGAFRINRDWFGVTADNPVERLADLASATKAWLTAENGTPVRYTGPFYSVNADVRAPVLGRLDVPVLLAAFNRRMARTAARTADGVIGHGLFTRRWWKDVVRPATERGVSERDCAGTVRPLEHGWVITAVDDGAPERAVWDARRMIAFYLTVKTYDPYVAFHGWEGPVQQLRAAFANSDTDAMAAAVTDEMLTAIAICGSTADARTMLRDRAGSFPRDIAYFTPPAFLVSHRRRTAYGHNFLPLVNELTARS